MGRTLLFLWEIDSSPCSTLPPLHATNIVQERDKGRPIMLGAGVVTGVVGTRLDLTSDGLLQLQLQILSPGFIPEAFPIIGCGHKAAEV